MLIRAIFMNEKGLQDKTFQNDYKVINELIGFDDAWNTPKITIDDERYIIVCSDLGKIKHYPVVAIGLSNLTSQRGDKTTLNEPFIVGPIMITKFDGVDDFASLTDDDVERIKSHVLKLDVERDDWYREILVFED